MADFVWAMDQLTIGSRVTREGWPNHRFLTKTNKAIYQEHIADDGGVASSRALKNMSTADILATDWKIFEEIKLETQIRDFGWALDQLKAGLCVGRRGFEGKLYFKGYPSSNSIMVESLTNAPSMDFVRYVTHAGYKDLFAEDYFLYEESR